MTDMQLVGWIFGLSLNSQKGYEFRNSLFHTSWKTIAKCRVQNQTSEYQTELGCVQGRKRRKRGMGCHGSLAWTECKPQSCWYGVGAGLEPSLMNVPWGKWVCQSARGQKIAQSPSWEVKQVLMCKKRQQQLIHTSERAGGSYKLPGKGSDLRVSSGMQQRNAHWGLR